MQAVYARHKFERRLFIDGMLWSIAGIAAYMMARQAGTEWFLPTTVQIRVSELPVQQFSDAFPMFSAIIALSLLCSWGLRCGRYGAALVCAGWMAVGVGIELIQRSDVASWVLPNLPAFFRTVWPFSALERLLGNGGFDPNQVFAAVLAGFIGYVMVLNSIPNRYRG